MSNNEDVDPQRRRHDPPYHHQHKIPTIAGYREEKENRLAKARGIDEDNDQEPATKKYLNNAQGENNARWGSQHQDHAEKQSQQGQQQEQEDTDLRDTSEAAGTAADPKQRRKQFHHSDKKKEERAERVVTDPVTHLPVKIYDLTSDSLQEVPENDEPFGTTPRTATGVAGKKKAKDQLDTEKDELQQTRESTEALFPPPDIDTVRRELSEVNSKGMAIGLGGTAAIGAVAFGVERLLDVRNMSWGTGVLAWTFITGAAAGAILALVKGVKDWTSKKLDRVWDEEVWEANRSRKSKAEETETVAWLNSIVGSVWPLINPDLFLSIADMLEDVMQASLPRFVRMVSVDDVGQGSESIRVLGVRWLPTGAAARSVGEDGELKNAEDGGHEDDPDGRKGSDEDAVHDENGENTEKADDGSEAVQGMDAEEGDFINLEVAFAYRVRTNSKSIRDRAKDMHLYMAFYLPGNVKLPVWVDLRAIVGTMRLRLQLCPDPPFFSLCTLTFLGQPKVDISCTPLSKHAPNILDLPLISNFVQSSVDAAMAEYVAPKSLNLDLKDMLAGDDNKKDTEAHGVIVVHIKRGFDFKAGDEGIPLIKDGSSDPYVSVGWAKFGKPIYSTRLLMSEMEPRWDETCYLLVTPEELNVQERVRVQLWDSDRFSADDDLGRIEIDLSQLMRSENSCNKMWERSDGFRALKAGEDMPGKLEWSVGYFAKTGIQDCQLERQTFDPEIKSIDQLKEKVNEVCERKLREANIKEGRHSRDADELKQQKEQELHSWESSMVMSSPPPEGFPSGVFGIQIHQITGLELEKLSKDKDDKGTSADDEEEEGEGLPSAYCTIIINHKKVFKTRTKPKNAKPFYNAGTERFVGDWQNAEVYVSVRDARVNEEDPLLGIVHLPLSEVFKSRSQISGFYPLVGGVAYGRVRISMCWRSIQYTPGPEALGWQLGTLQVKPGIEPVDLPQNLQGLKLKFTTDLGADKMHSGGSRTRRSDVHSWSPRKDRSLRLPVAQRYNSCLAIEFRQHGVLKDSAAAFAVFWLRDIPDEEERELTLPVWKGDFPRATACSLEEPGEKVGAIKLKLKFWSGLGGAHEKWAKTNDNVRNVYEVLECARDNSEEVANEKKAGILESSETGSETDGEADSSDEETGDADNGSSARGEENGGEGGPIDKIKQYKKHEKGMHRRHRGLMQFRIPRTAKWAMNKVESTGDSVSGVFKHHTRQPGIETEA